MIAFGVAFLGALAPLVSSMPPDQASQPIYLEESRLRLPKTQKTAVTHQCVISESESCSLASMPLDESTQVYPGGNTRCIYSDSTDYSFQVIPGDADKLLYYFQGGGACWSEATTGPLFCSTDAVPMDLVGVFNREDERNRYKDYTIIHVLYCSGDVHAGNVTRDYNDKAGPNGQPVQQLGYYNAKAVLDWTLQQQASGQLQKASDFVIMGCSAGAMGTQLWTDVLLNSIQYERVGIVPDSYLGVFPEGVEGELISSYGFCDTPLLDPVLYDSCVSDTLTFEAIMKNTFPKHVDVPFAYIQSKVDSIQLLFYLLLGAPTDQNATGSEFYYYSNELLEVYNDYENVAFYLVDGSVHCFTNYDDRYYNADTCGSNVENNTEPTCDKEDNVEWMYEWTNKLPFPPPDEDEIVLDTTCTGDVVDPDITSNSTTYCNTNILPKTVSNGGDVNPSSEDEDDDDNVDTTVAVSVSVVAFVAFAAGISFFVYAKKAPAPAKDDKDPSLRSSLLTSDERSIAHEGSGRESVEL